MAYIISLVVKTMCKTLNQYMREIPVVLGNEIFKYICPNDTDVRFSQYNTTTHMNNYSDRYQVAYGSATSQMYSMLHRIKNRNRLFLSRISKKNGRHRYYITRETKTTACDECDSPTCNARYCGGSYMHEALYSSTYVGKDLNLALIILFTQF